MYKKVPGELFLDMWMVAVVTCVRVADIYAANGIRISWPHRTRKIGPYLSVRGHRPKRVCVNSFLFLWIRIFSFDSNCLRTAITWRSTIAARYATKNKSSSVSFVRLLTLTQNNRSDAIEMKNKSRQREEALEKVLPSSSLRMSAVSLCGMSMSIPWIKSSKIGDTQYEAISVRFPVSGTMADGFWYR